MLERKLLKLTDKEYIRKYADAADRAIRDKAPSLKRNPVLRRHMDEFLQQHRRLAKDIAKANVGNMPPQPAAKAKAMRRSIDKVRDGAGVLHLQPKRPRFA